MCRHLEARPVYTGGRHNQETDRAVEDFCADIPGALELVRKLLSLADGPWRECDHSGRIALEGILRECAHSIVTEAMRRRMEIEATGRVTFGTVLIEESIDSDEADPHPVAAHQRGSPPFLESHPQDPTERFVSGTSFAVSSAKTEPSPLGALRRSCSAFLASALPGGPRWPAAGPRRGGA